MPRVMIQDYPHRLAGHCGSGALRDLLDWAGLGWDGPPGEALVFGLGGGLDFHWMWLPDADPLLYLGGRTKDLELTLCARLGIAVEPRRTEDPAEAWEWVAAELDEGRPVMVWTDILELPYLRVRLSNTRHDLVVVGYDTDAGTAYVADNDREEIQEVSLDALAKARDSQGFPGPNRNATYPMRFPERLPDLLPVARDAAAASVEALCHGEGVGALLPASIGYAGQMEGIARFAETFSAWPDLLPPEALGRAYRSLSVFIEKAGTGGGLFRRLQAGFCRGVAALTGDAPFREAASSYAACAAAWSALASAAAAPDPDPGDLARLVSALRPLEERAADDLAKAAAAS